MHVLCFEKCAWTRTELNEFQKDIFSLEIFMLLNLLFICIMVYWLHKIDPSFYVL